MKLIFAQGNPGPEYASSRHNIGFMALDYMCKHRELAKFQQKSKFQALLSEFLYKDEKIILAKPTTFYNQTGQAARAIADFYGIRPDDILVIHDELALEFGTVRVRNNGSDAGNKGIRSLIAHLGPDFWRIRVGIKNDLAERMQGADFVLASFSQAEKATLTSAILPVVENMIDQFLKGSLSATSENVKNPALNVSRPC